MTTLPENHFIETEKIIRKIDKQKIAEWLLLFGYFPEQYVLPPCFKVQNFLLQKKPYYCINKIPVNELIKVAFPKSQLKNQTFAIIEPKSYHDIVWNLINEWDFVIKHLFNHTTNIFPYSFPIPITKKDIGNLGILRSGRMIYEFIEMAENDLVAEAYKYKYLLRTDITNFYPSIYTHSISWALHGKKKARQDRSNNKLLGNKLDKLIYNANDGCTNGLAIGPALSDLISEILLTRLDVDLSAEVKSEGIDILGVRFKDDYRILCKSKDNALRILKILQEVMSNYNLQINENKSIICELPEGLYRPWTIEYEVFSLKKEKTIKYKKFESTFLALLNIDSKYPSTGIIDKFLSELFSDDFSLKLSISDEEASKVVSLLIMLKERRSKSFPLILSCIELLINSKKNNTNLTNDILQKLYCLSESSKNLYDILWLDFVLIKFNIKLPNHTNISSPLYKSMISNSQKFFNSDRNIILFRKFNKINKVEELARHFAIFNRNIT